MELSNICFKINNNFVNDCAAQEASDIFNELSEKMSSLEVNTPSPGTSSNDDYNAEETGSPSKRLPSRSAKEHFLQKCKRRVIAKPKKKEVKMSAAFIRKLYIENKPKNFKPSNLETIYEEPIEIKNELKFIDVKKKRRSLTCTDGLNVTKTVIKGRRLKIKRTFGRKFTHKKMSLEDFIQRLNASLESQCAEKNDTKLLAATNSYKEAEVSMITNSNDNI